MRDRSADRMVCGAYGACPLAMVSGLTAALALAAPTLGSTIIHVPADQPTIAEAIMAAHDGDVIQLAPGAYSEAFSFGFKAVTLRGTPSNPSATTVAPLAVNGGSLLTIPAMPEGEMITIEGVTLGGFAEFSVIDGSLALRDSVVTADGGGLSIAFGVTNGSLIVERVTIADSGYEPHQTPLFHVHAGFGQVSDLTVLAGSRPIFRGLASESVISRAAISALTLDPSSSPGTGHTGAIESSGGELIVLDSSFTGIGPGSGVVATGTVLLDDVDFVGVGHPFKGFDCGVIASGPDVSLIGCTFTGCGSFAAAASAAMLGGANILVDSCTVSDNLISDTGTGGLRIDGDALIRWSTFTGNASFGHGGAMSVHGEASIEECIFEGNAGGDGAGAIDVLGAATITRSEFALNRAGDGFYGTSVAGGAIAVDGGNAHVEECLFRGNLAGDPGKGTGLGGAVAALNGGELFLVDSSLLENAAQTVGGGLYVDSLSVASLSGTTICSNVPDQAAGLFADLGANILCGCSGDLNGDRQVDAADLAIVLGSWGPCSGVAADLSPDGIIDGSDLAVILGAWGACD